MPPAPTVPRCRYLFLLKLAGDLGIPKALLHFVSICTRRAPERHFGAAPRGRTSWLCVMARSTLHIFPPCTCLSNPRLPILLTKHGLGAASKNTSSDCSRSTKRELRSAASLGRRLLLPHKDQLRCTDVTAPPAVLHATTTSCCLTYL